MEDPNQTRSIIYSSNPVAKHKEVLFLKRVVEWTKKSVYFRWMKSKQRDRPEVDIAKIFV